MSMTNNTSIKLFESKKVRSIWDSEQGKWYISIVDVIEVLTESANPRRYWSDLKIKLKKEGSQLYENFVQLKMRSVTNCNQLKTQSVTNRNQLKLSSVDGKSYRIKHRRCDNVSNRRWSVRMVHAEPAVARCPNYQPRQGLNETPCSTPFGVVSGCAACHRFRSLGAKPLRSLHRRLLTLCAGGATQGRKP